MLLSGAMPYKLKISFLILFISEEKNQTERNKMFCSVW